MHRFFVSKDDIGDDNIIISGDDAAHISKVLRLKAKDAVIVCDGEENEYTCLVSAIDKKKVICSIVDKRHGTSEPPCKIDLYQGIPKSVKMDIIIQKCTEIGVGTVIPVDTERVVVKLGNERDSNGKTARWQRIAEEASKQSSRGRIPTVESPINYHEAIDRLKEYDLAIMPYEKEASIGLKQALRGKTNIRSIGIFIGPEGGFTDQEVLIAQESKILPVTLGPRILRTETAGFVCLSIAMYELGDMGGEPWIE